MDERTIHGDCHSQLCRSLYCPCYLTGVNVRSEPTEPNRTWPHDRTLDEYRNEIRRLQAWISDLTRDSGELSCEDLCPIVCAGPCTGIPLGPHFGSTAGGDDDR